MLLPYRSKNPPESMPLVTILLIVINTLVFVLTSDGFQIREDVVKVAALTANNISPVTVFTSTFLHGDIFHLLGNMWFLYLFGFSVEGRLRSGRFLPLYLVSGILGALAHHMVVGVLHPEMPSLGASGAIMGLLGAAIFMFPYGKVDWFYWVGWFWRGTFTMPMWGVGLFYLGQDFLFGVLFGASDGVAHFAHLGGAVAGFLFAALYRPQRDNEAASEARANFAEAKDMSLLASYELAAMHKGNPTDPLIVLNWVHRGLRDPGGPKPESIAAFQKLLPKIVNELDIRSVGYCVAALCQKPGVIPNRYLADVGSRLEREGEYANAFQLYEAVLRDPKASEADQESAVFRAGMLCERAFKNPKRATENYTEVVSRWPMSPFAEQARLRLKVLERQMHQP